MMEFRIKPYANNFHWYISMKLVDGDNEQEFISKGEYYGTKLESFMEAQEHMKCLLENIRRTIEYGSMLVIHRELLHKKEMREVKLTDNWRIE